MDQSEAAPTEASRTKLAARFRFGSSRCVAMGICGTFHGLNGWDLIETNGLGDEVNGGFGFSQQGLHR
jgi:hypothetical protein